jgi:D-glycero-alpha-D-manno-heptose-7-phosphate kinase
MADRAGRLRFVTTVTPLRLSFAGGGTDFADYYRQHGGAVVSTAIDKYIYVTIKQHSELFGEKFRLNYSKAESVNNIDEIENAIARECLRLLRVDEPLFVSTIADLPGSSGLGSSSSFAVGLLYALHVLRGQDVSAGQLAEEATEVEINLLKRPIGKQDQYAAAFGGLNHIVFDPSGRVNIDALHLPIDDLNAMFAHCMLFWTGVQRDAGDVLSEQQRNIGERQAELHVLHEMAGRCRDLLLSRFDPKRFGAILHEGWMAKQQLSRGVSNSQINAWYQLALERGALGGKIAGAGGGGFLYLVVPPERQPGVRQALAGMTEVAVGFEPRGSRLLFTNNGW